MGISENATLQRPWWDEARAPWYGHVFDRFVLTGSDPGEQRVQRLRSDLKLKYADGKRKISMERALLVTASYKETEGEHPALRRAKAIASVFEKIRLPQHPLQLLAGTSAGELHAVELQPEFLVYGNDVKLDSHISGQWIDEHYIYDREERRTFELQIAPYWREKGRSAILTKELKANYPDVWHFINSANCYTAALGGALYHTIQDYRTILQIGLAKVKQRISAHIAELDASHPHGMSDFDRLNHYRAMIIVSDGMITYARRYADMLDGLSEQERDQGRRTELAEMSRICRKVPEYPAESWWEALQAWHFLHMGTGLAEGGNSHSAGRFDQYMLPFVRRDLDARAITAKKAQELLECFFIKWNETQTSLSDDTAQGVGNNDKLTIGGIDARGHDITNELSYMCLEAHAHVHMNDPNISVRVHKNTPDEFLEGVLEVVRLGTGLPILINDEAIIPSLVSNGVSLADARNYADCGCQENLTDPNTSPGADTHGHTNSGWFNLVKPIELAMFNGVNPVNGVQVGPQSGDPRTFDTMEQFIAAVRVQYDFAVRTNVILSNLAEYTFARYYPCVFHNLMHPGPRDSGITMNAGGCKYNWTGSLAVGTANAGDIMTAIDRLIYAERVFGWEELLASLRSNWAEFPETRQLCMAAPKYGTNSDEADRHVRDILSIYFDTFESYSTPRGGRFVGGLITMSAYEVLGRSTGATPDGRKSGEALADSTAPSCYATGSGPLSAHRSAARAIDTHRTVNGITFNQRLNLSLVATDRDLHKWADMVRTYVEAEGTEVQYSIADKLALLDAQKNPEKHKDLVVRIGGHSAFFNELSREVQDSVIASFAG